MAAPRSVPFVFSAAPAAANSSITAAEGGIGREAGQEEVLLEELVEGDAEVDAGVDRLALDVVALGDRRRKRVADHLHVGIGGADGLVGGLEVTGRLSVDDGLGLKDVVGHQVGDGVLRQPGGAGQEGAELGDVDGGQVVDGAVGEGRVIGRDAGGVVDEEPVVGAPDAVPLVLGLGAVDGADGGAEVGAVRVQQAAVGLELIGPAVERRTGRLGGQDEVLAEQVVEIGPQVGGALVMSVSPPMSMDSSGDIGAIDSELSGAVDSAALGSVDVPVLDVQAARANQPTSSSDVGFQVRKGGLLCVEWRITTCDCPSDTRERPF